MAKLTQKHIAKMEQPIGAALLERISWDDLRVFVVVARTLSFRKAATALRTSTSTVSRRVERLEEILNSRLFDRLPDGLGLTAEGRSFTERRKTWSAPVIRCGLTSIRT